MVSKEITTIKLGRNTKERLEHLKVYHRETFDEIMQKIFGILNICRIDPERARSRLMSIDRQRKRTPGQIKKEREEIKKETESNYSEDFEENPGKIESQIKNPKSNIP